MKHTLLTLTLAFFGLSAQAQVISPILPQLVKSFQTPKEDLCTETFEQPLFKTRVGEIPYRIPAIATAKNGNIIAVTDYRHCKQDIGFGRVDLHYRYSNNNGYSWTKELVMAEGNGIEGDPRCGYGDAAIVADSKSNEVIVVCVTGNTVYSHPTTTRENPNRVAIIRSYDNGETWNAPEEITESIYSLFDKSKLGPVQSLFFGSGRICQSSQIKVKDYYRIYAALCARPGGNRVVYSDDFGRTWHALGTIDVSPAPNGDEPKIEELPDGNVLLSSRAWGGRHFNIYSYISKKKATGEWCDPIASNDCEGGIIAKENACNGEVMIIDAVKQDTNESVQLALHSVPLGPGRKNVGIYFKPLNNKESYQSPTAFASDWSGPYQVSDINSAYSTMCLQPDGRIGFFYEEETYGPNTAYTEIYIPLSIEKITGGAYTSKQAKEYLLNLKEIFTLGLAK